MRQTLNPKTLKPHKGGGNDPTARGGPHPSPNERDASTGSGGGSGAGWQTALKAAPCAACAGPQTTVMTWG